MPVTRRSRPARRDLAPPAPYPPRVANFGECRPEAGAQAGRNSSPTRRREWGSSTTSRACSASSPPPSSAPPVRTSKRDRRRPWPRSLGPSRGPFVPFLPETRPATCPPEAGRASTPTPAPGVHASVSAPGERMRGVPTAQHGERMRKELRAPRGRRELTPEGLPGRFTMSVRPRVPASPRESAANGVASAPRRRIASAMPGASRSARRAWPPA
jgi:hypothetical protein